MLYRKEWLDEKADDWALPTRNRYLALMKLAYRLAERGQRIKVNPARLVRQTKENNGRVRWLMEEEEKALRAVIEKKYSDHLPEFEISLMTGMRQEEQFSVTWECVDLKAGIINLGETKNGTGRMVCLNSRALAVMNMLHESSIGTGPVFLLNKKPRWFKGAVDEAKLVDFTWHCLRHTWATRLLQKGVDVKTVQEMGGWKTIAMVMRYTHADPRRFGPALEKLCESSATNSATQQEHAQQPVAHQLQ